MYKHKLYIILFFLICAAFPARVCAFDYGLQPDLEVDYSLSETRKTIEEFDNWVDESMLGKSKKRKLKEEVREKIGFKNDYYVRNKKTSPFTIYNVVSEKPIRYCLYPTLSQTFNASQGKAQPASGLDKVDYVKLMAWTQRAHDAWTKDIPNMIKRHGRSKEFNDFLPEIRAIFTGANIADPLSTIGRLIAMLGKDDVFLDNGLDGKLCDLFIIYDKDYCGGPGKVSYFRRGPIPHMCFNRKDIIQEYEEEYGELTNSSDDKYMKEELEKLQKTVDNTTFIHELGHAFGLIDQYEGDKTTVEKGKNTVKYSSIRARKGVMNESEKLSCDDMDGFVCLYYLVKKQDKTFKSFCNDGVIIENCIQKK